MYNQVQVDGTSSITKESTSSDIHWEAEDRKETECLLKWNLKITRLHM